MLFFTIRNFDKPTFPGKQVLFLLQLPNYLFVEIELSDMLHFTTSFRTKFVCKNYSSRQPQREFENAQTGNVTTLRDSFVVFKVSVILVCSKEISFFMNRLKPQPKLFPKISREQSTKNRYQHWWTCCQRKDLCTCINKAFGNCLWAEILSSKRWIILLIQVD